MSLFDYPGSSFYHLAPCRFHHLLSCFPKDGVVIDAVDNHLKYCIVREIENQALQEVLSDRRSRIKGLSCGRASIYKLTKRADNWEGLTTGLRHRESPDEANRGKSQRQNGKQGVAEIRGFMVNCIVTKGKSDFGYTLGYNFKNRHKERSKDRVISPQKYY